MASVFLKPCSCTRPAVSWRRPRVWRGLTEEVALGLSDALFVTIPRGRYDDLEAQVQMEPELSAPLEEGHGRRYDQRPAR